jgi:hypothetical protein
MTRKDYQLIANAVNLAHWLSANDKYRLGVNQVALDLATVLERENPRFNRDLFLAACRGE